VEIRKYGIGDTIIAVVKSSTKYACKRSDVVAIIVRTKKSVRRQDGMYIRFDDKVVLVNMDNNPRGTVSSDLLLEIRDKTSLKSFH
jgi:large subunit ribosomal protein L14